MYRSFDVAVEKNRTMMYPYLTFDDDTEVTHSGIIEDGDVEKVLVHFERPTEASFDFIRCEPPSYTWTP